MWLFQANIDMKRLQSKYGISSFATAYWDSEMLARVLAKIGHSFAVAELGQTFLPLLPERILKGGKPYFRLVGGEQEISPKNPDALHELALGYQRAKNRRQYIVVRIRLFANQGGPTYYAVVAEAPSRRATLKRVLSRRISLMQSRQ